MAFHSLKTKVTATLAVGVLVALAGCGSKSGSGGDAGPESYIINSTIAAWTDLSWSLCLGSRLSIV